MKYVKSPEEDTKILCHYNILAKYLHLIWNKIYEILQL